LGNPLFLNAAGVFDVVKFKEYFKANPAQAQLKIERRMPTGKYQMYTTMIKAVYTQLKARKFK
jgi:peptidyl-prolyl cis-trans isomerase D